MGEDFKLQEKKNREEDWIPGGVASVLLPSPTPTRSLALRESYSGVLWFGQVEFLRGSLNNTVLATLQVISHFIHIKAQRMVLLSLLHRGRTEAPRG